MANIQNALKVAKLALIPFTLIFNFVGADGVLAQEGVMPSLVGRTYGAERPGTGELAEYNVTVIYADSASPRGTVIATTPPASERLEDGDRVVLVVSTGPLGDLSKNPQPTRPTSGRFAIFLVLQLLAVVVFAKVFRLIREKKPKASRKTGLV